MKYYIAAALFVGLITAAPSQPSLKNRLAQNNAKNLAQTESQEVHNDWQFDLGDCDYELPDLELPPLECPCEFSELPGLGGGVSQGFEQQAQVTQLTSLAAIPDTQFNQTCQTECCECAEAAHAALAAQIKTRVFNISGAIEVCEKVTFAERERAAENSQSIAEKNTVCVTNNQNGGVGSTPECIEIELCPPGVGGSLGASKKL